ncbi:hypothetical protein CEXT_572971 [Caerostris extrusa]|uniref:Uncharacterized protein n=1 Tax=Caerostris extrusa TaxID=172846 RepID=A0AAV4XX77_CAEEX|nr:hypothetical protein CEXT_572971 [Caerostris extrusa]
MKHENNEVIDSFSSVIVLLIASFGNCDRSYRVIEKIRNNGKRNRPEEQARQSWPVKRRNSTTALIPGESERFDCSPRVLGISPKSSSSRTMHGRNAKSLQASECCRKLFQLDESYAKSNKEHVSKTKDKIPSSEERRREEEDEEEEEDENESSSFGED